MKRMENEMKPTDHGKKNNSQFSILNSQLIICILLLACAIFLAAWTPLMRQRSFLLEDALLSLETSQGRERKQQHEYEEVTAALPEARAELARLQPQAEAAAEKVTALKEERKALREQKKALEEALEETVDN